MFRRRKYSIILQATLLIIYYHLIIIPSNRRPIIIIPTVYADDFSGHCQKSGCRTSPDEASTSSKKKVLDPSKSLQNYRDSQKNQPHYYASGAASSSGADNATGNNTPSNFMTLATEWIIAFFLLRFIVMYIRGNNIDHRKLTSIKTSIIDSFKSLVRAISNTIKEAKKDHKNKKGGGRRTVRRAHAGIRSSSITDGSVASLGSLVHLIGYDDEESQQTYDDSRTNTYDDSAYSSDADSTTYASYYSKAKNDWTTKRKRNSLIHSVDESSLGLSTLGMASLSSTVAIADHLQSSSNNKGKTSSHNKTQVNKRKVVIASKKKTKVSHHHNDDTQESGSNGSGSILSKFVTNLYKGSGSGTTKKNDKKKNDDGHHLRRSLQDDNHHHHNDNSNNNKGGGGGANRRRTLDTANGEQQGEKKHVAEEQKKKRPSNNNNNNNNEDEMKKKSSNNEQDKKKPNGKGEKKATPASG